MNYNDRKSKLRNILREKSSPAERDFKCELTEVHP